MARRATRLLGLTMVLAAAYALLGTVPALAGPIGMVCTNGPSFTLKATSGTIETPDGNSVFMWSYANNATGGSFQLPSPALCVNQGDLVTITLNNSLAEPTSIVFPGQENVLANGLLSQPVFSGAGSLSSLTATAAPGGSVTYSFVASKPGTYLYESGTDPSKQVEMGLYGALVVRPNQSIGRTGNTTNGSATITNLSSTAGLAKMAVSGAGIPPNAYVTAVNNATTVTINAPASATASGVALSFNKSNWAYDNARTAFDPSREYLLVFHEIDPDLHHQVETGGGYDFNAFHPRYFTVTGRAFPDTIQNNGVPWLPTQPYGSLVRVKPYDSGKNPLPAMVRMVNAGLLNHPFHPHGFHVQEIAQDGRLFETPSGGDASTEHFGDMVPAGASQDSLFTYVDQDKFCSGTSCNAAGYSNNPLPAAVVIPSYRNLMFKDNVTWYSGSPYLGAKGTLPTPVVSYNVCGEFYFPWHSHALNEFVNYDEGFGGLATLLRVDPLPGCTAFPSSTKINVGGLKGGSYINLTALEATPSYYQVNSAYQVSSSPATTVRTPGISASSTTLPVASAAGFPAVPFYVQVDSEKMRVTALGSGGINWTVVRGQLSTTAATHATGVSVALVTAVSDWYGALTGVAQGALNLKVSYQGRNCGTASSASTCVAVPTAIPTAVSIWNWKTSSWIQLSSAPVGLAEVPFNALPVAPSPAAGKWSDYIGTGVSAGQVRVRVSSQLTSPAVTGSPAFSSWGNFMKLTYDAP